MTVVMAGISADLRTKTGPKTCQFRCFLEHLVKQIQAKVNIALYNIPTTFREVYTKYIAVCRFFMYKLHSVECV